MGKGSKSGACKSSNHHLLKDRAKNRVDDLQGMFSDLQSARKESRTVDVSILEEQVHQMLREWKAELNEPSPASSLQQQEGSLGSFSSEIYRLLHLCDEEDDATSALAAPKPEPEGTKAVNQSNTTEVFDMSTGPQEQVFQSLDQCKIADIGVNHLVPTNHVTLPTQLNYPSFDFHPEIEHQHQHQHQQQYYSGFDGSYFVENDDITPQIIFPPPPSAFLGPKCALWDCPRPALGSDWCQKSDDYCSTYHARLAPDEGCQGRPPVVRPGGIGLKDNLLFAALSTKAQGKYVGIPECEGAATAKSPWNAPELFDLIVLDGESIREWLFFDKPRRAFESGNRKQRSLPDYNGRGWHESRKQVMNEFGGLKRSYYMDPQPMETFEWHLYEYEINKCDACALYRLEVKRADGKKSLKGKFQSNGSVADLQKQMGRLSAEFPNEKKRTAKGGNGNSNVHSGSDRMPSPAEGIDYLVDSIDGYYVT